MSEEILLTVTPARVMVDPGGTAQVVLQIQNRTAVVDDFVVDVLGDAASWTTLECPQVAVFPDGVASVQVTIHPPRAASPAAGSVPVGFRVRSSVNPALSSVEECRVEVKPFVEIAGEIAPKTARGRFSATHKLRVINKGNAPVNVSVRAEVQQGDAQIAVSAGTFVVDRGQRTMAKIKVRPGSSRWQGADEMHSYRLNLEPQGGTPVPIDAMMRQRPILGVPLAALAVVALLVVAALGIYGKGPGAPIQTALRSWTGVIDNAPSASATQQVANAAAQQQAQAPAQPKQTVVNAPTQAPTAAPLPTPTVTPSQPAVSPAVTPPPVVHPVCCLQLPPPVYTLRCSPLSAASLTDTLSGTTHTLAWSGTTTCNGYTYTGTITANYSGIRVTCLFPYGTCTRIPFSASHVYSINGLTGTQIDSFAPNGTTSVSYALSLTDGTHTVTATAT